jgi:hypothetical protein
MTIYMHEKYYNDVYKHTHQRGTLNLNVISSMNMVKFNEIDIVLLEYLNKDAKDVDFLVNLVDENIHWGKIIIILSS